ncbi:type IV pilin protein [Halomonas urumqiensis]|uniref:Methylation site containing protein n=1 Tax=Halomonas urumqiensis TaxID=1684789 RepID=A0A2N7UI89_9GAMM|nr:type IV pilin protein [Halomonas urumqiensis]PMR80120.1 methylation site containing protein [Halomonas urumqiensis]PTB01245.1 type IV pilin protein [Halomonas urumqiensis]
MPPSTRRTRPQGHTGNTRRAAGFTLIELMIAVAVVGILASIAYPSYTRYVQQARVSEGVAVLMDVAGQLERCYTVNNTYAEASCIAEADLPDSESGVYTLTYNDPAPGATFTLEATHDGSQVTSGCETLTIDQTGATAPADCW